MASSDLFASLAQLLSQQQGGSTGSGGLPKVAYSSASCLDPQCKHKLFFPVHEASVECPNCGQRHSVVDLPDRRELGDKDQRFGVELAQVRNMYAANKKTAEQVKVKGVSNFQCKLLSPLLSIYGMGKNDQPCTLQELGVGPNFDCLKLSNRSFAIEEAHLNVLGYGLDRSGSQAYLRDTLEQLREANDGVDTLLPLHADGDGHCLVHAISRCLVGRELFWHALRSNLYTHLTSNLQRYQNLFKDFYSEEEWEGIIAEAGPDWKPPDGQTLGLCNIHVYGLANVLHRPIILLDSLSGMHSSGDYSAIFLPTMCTPKECSSKDGHGALRLNSPIVIAWGNSGRNHFIPLVPIKGRPLPKLPTHLQPKVWGSGEHLLNEYVVLEDNGGIEVCRGKELTEKYLLRLIKCMESVFLEKNKVLPSLVTDVNQYVYKVAGYVGMATDTIITTTRDAVEEERLFRCLICSALSIVPGEWLTKGGLLYQKAADTLDLPNSHKLSFPYEGITAEYNSTTDSLVPVDVNCFCCSSITRKVLGDGSLVYENGDRTLTESAGSRCGCGYMHFWDGNEYDNLPEKIPLSLAWGGKSISLTTYWFQYESDATRNSNVYQVANKAVSDHFPGEFGSERLVQQVVDHILRVTEDRAGMEQVSGHHPTQPSSQPSQTPPSQSPNTPPEEVPASKIILVGNKSRTIHKEELTMSEAERNVHRRVEENARITQNKRTSAASSSSVSPKSPVSTAPTSKTTPSPISKTPPTKPQDTTVASCKRIRVTSSDGKATNLSLEANATFSQFQEAIERELNIPASRQKLRSGFPPRELLPPDDPTRPLDLANGEKVSVDVIAPLEEVSPATPSLSAGVSSRQEQAQTISTLLQHMLGKQVDLWSIAQYQPQLFRNGGDYYQQVVERFDSHLEDNTHIQFKEFPNKTFSFNASSESLEVCLGNRHVPVGPLSPEMIQLAADASSSQPGNHDNNPEAGRLAEPLKAFSGKGHTLSSATPPQKQQSAERDDPIMRNIRHIAEKKLKVLREQETELQQKVRALNRKLVEAEAGNHGDDSINSIETQLINTSSDLKILREEIQELLTL